LDVPAAATAEAAIGAAVDGSIAEGASDAEWAASGGAAQHYIHTSGHASSADLRRFAAASGAKTLVPIHSFTWDENMEGFPPIQRVRDGETMVL